MGTNYYTKTGKHIGKKSAAGLFCWECNISLCEEGNAGIHKGKSRWFNECPVCGKAPVKEDICNSSAGRELGFNKNEYSRKKGVKSCSSFNWAILPCSFKNKIIIDEYERKFTRSEFNDILKECPVQFFHSIGEQFS